MRRSSRAAARARQAAGSLLLIVVTTVVITPMPARATTFTNPSTISIPDYGLFVPYPSTIQVTGLTGTIVDVNVMLQGLDHQVSGNIDLLLVGPAGTGYAVLMADVGGLNGVTADLVFDDTASPFVCSSQITSGTYRPTNCGSYTADPSLTNTALSTFNGKAPNGTWELYGFDDAAPYPGTIAGGWTLEVQSNGPTITSFTPTSGPVGTSVAIEGTNLNGATAVRFGGVSAMSFTVDSATGITATVPEGAMTGPIEVTTPNATATSTTSFIVTTGTPDPTDHAREVSLSLGRVKARGRVSVADGFGDCVDNVRVKVQRRNADRWRTIGSDATAADGRYVVPTPGPGAYRAIAKRLTLASGDVCLKDVSPTVRRGG